MGLLWRYVKCPEQHRQPGADRDSICWWLATGCLRPYPRSNNGRLCPPVRALPPPRCFAIGRQASISPRVGGQAGRRAGQRKEAGLRHCLLRTMAWQPLAHSSTMAAQRVLEGTAPWHAADPLPSVCHPAGFLPATAPAHWHRHKGKVNMA